MQTKFILKFSILKWFVWLCVYFIWVVGINCSIFDVDRKNFYDSSIACLFMRCQTSQKWLKFSIYIDIIRFLWDVYSICAFFFLNKSYSTSFRQIALGKVFCDIDSIQTYLADLEPFRSIYKNNLIHPIYLIFVTFKWNVYLNYKIWHVFCFPLMNFVYWQYQFGIIKFYEDFSSLTYWKLWKKHAQFLITFIFHLVHI